MAASKYPIIFVYGIFVKEMKHFKAFGGIEKALKKVGFDVYTAHTDGFGTIENNALQLKEEIEKILKQKNVEKVNIIAYSKGGNDAIYMLDNLGMQDSVASVTMLSAPLKGSRLADVFLSVPKFLLKPGAVCMNCLYKILGDKHPNSFQVLHELKHIPDEEYPPEIEFPSIYCQSYSSRINSYFDDLLLGVPFKILQRFEKTPCDGAVTANSAKWGEYKGECMAEPLSHRQLMDFLVGKKKKQKLYQFYISLCRDLAERGF
ncbi:MAG: hypothetical protein K2M75_02505 [Clostridia bacterium]|nr:hypothetical protein [Clostridia bacterium]